MLPVTEEEGEAQEGDEAGEQPPVLGQQVGDGGGQEANKEAEQVKQEWMRNGGGSDLDLAGGVGDGHQTHGEGPHGTDNVQASVGGSHCRGEQKKEKEREKENEEEKENENENENEKDFTYFAH